MCLRMAVRSANALAVYMDASDAYLHARCIHIYITLSTVGAKAQAVQLRSSEVSWTSMGGAAAISGSSISSG
ncbi:hypothetical protein KDAU_11220 [Dictyobacter aurantiacus]|uniref:Uncharacterized protein n=1 Tax=Dictyobacter aurantiacus TaxID=1936993 RepID=A0A401ZAE2_9CHLR|nr:hypothetical protein KDAU_11220 [Dictyobacter aurantiacus]